MRVSIVTPSFNQAPYLRQTLASVLSQAGPFELSHVVVDGGSTDGSVALLQSISDPRLSWTSGPDRGQSDAVNRGINRATGDVIGWLNSDDLYLPNALASVAEAFDDPRVQWVVGRYQIINDVGDVLRPAVVRYKERSLRRYRYRALLRENFIPQPAVFWRREFGRRVGPLDESLHYAMDYDLWLRMGRACDPIMLDRPLAQFRVHGQSKTGRIDRRQFDEGYRVACRYFDGDQLSRWGHRLNVEKIVWAYRAMQIFGR